MFGRHANVFFLKFQMDREFVYFLGYLVHLDWTSLILPIIFHKIFDQHVCQIGESIKNNVIYAKVIAHILVPEFADEFDLFKVVTILNSFTLS